ncbi:hypothetical protein C8Q75DRAFT_606716 [Abortiporus biennis]|nr:hypothetical protein C8Q75DRAFT_606716 [Abortiporus biennis]
MSPRSDTTGLCDYRKSLPVSCWPLYTSTTRSKFKLRTFKQCHVYRAFQSKHGVYSCQSRFRRCPSSKEASLRHARGRKHTNTPLPPTVGRTVSTFPPLSTLISSPHLVVGSVAFSAIASVCSGCRRWFVALARWRFCRRRLKWFVVGVLSIGDKFCFLGLLWR